MAEEDPAYPDAPPERVDLADGMALVRVRPERARAAVAAINESLEHLRPWMAWAQEPATEASIGTFFAAAEAIWDQRRDFGYSIVEPAPPGSPLQVELVVRGCGVTGRAGLAPPAIGS